MVEGAVAANAQHVIGSLSDQHTANHRAMWEMLLTVFRTFPTAWEQLDFAKLVVPRLTAFVR